MNRWYRRYAGTVSDPKIAEAALIAECGKAVVIATWDMILESAAETNEGGKFKATSRNVAATLGETPATIARVFAALETLEMIVGDLVGAWSKRQYQSDSSTERSRKHRASKRSNGDATGMQRCATPPDTESDTDSETEIDQSVRPEYDAAPAKANGHDEISGLNGSTGEIVGGIAKFLNNLSPDYVSARRIVASNVGLYGDRAVRDGYAELIADVEDNKVRVPSAKVLQGYFKTASERPQQQRSPKPSNDYAAQRIERGKEFLSLVNGESA